MRKLRKKDLIILTTLEKRSSFPKKREQYPLLLSLSEIKPQKKRKKNTTFSLKNYKADNRMDLETQQNHLVDTTFLHSAMGRI